MDRSPAEQLRSIRSESAKPIPRESVSKIVKQTEINFLEPKEDKYPPCGTFKGNDLVSLRVSSSLIKSMFYLGEPRNVCPKKLYHTRIKGDVIEHKNINMIYGNYFEYLCLGATRSGYIPKRPLLASGKVSVHVERIEEQAMKFPIIIRGYEMIVIKYGKPGQRSNTQISAEVEWPVELPIKVTVSMTSDFITPIKHGETGFDSAVVDLKLTSDLSSRFGEYCWATPEEMDLTQAVLGSALFDMPFYFLVFDYKKDGRGHKLIPIATKAMFKNGVKPEDENHYQLAKRRFADLKIVISNVVETILKWDSEGYVENPSYKECKSCPLSPVMGGNCKHFALVDNLK